MKTFLFGLLLFSFSNLRSQKIFSCDYRSDAEIKVWVSKSRSDADLIVYQTSWKSEADKNEGIWYFADWRGEADKRIYFTD